VSSLAISEIREKAQLITMAVLPEARNAMSRRA
jgi:hypothetical protein